MLIQWEITLGADSVMFHSESCIVLLTITDMEYRRAGDVQATVNRQPLVYVSFL